MTATTNSASTSKEADSATADRLTRHHDVRLAFNHRCNLVSLCLHIARRRSRWLRYGADLRLSISWSSSLFTRSYWGILLKCLLLRLLICLNSAGYFNEHQEITVSTHGVEIVHCTITTHGRQCCVTAHRVRHLQQLTYKIVLDLSDVVVSFAAHRLHSKTWESLIKPIMTCFAQSLHSSSKWELNIPPLKVYYGLVSSLKIEAGVELSGRQRRLR